MKTFLLTGRAVLCAVICCAAALFVCTAFADVAFTPDGFLIRDGRPHLILGLYELPADDAVLDQIAHSGINLVSTPADQTALDRLQKHGLWGWIPLGSQVALVEGDAGAQQKLAELVGKFKGHPALVAWEGPDEALWNEWFKSYDWLTAEQPKQLGALIQQAAATHSKEDVERWGGMLGKTLELALRSMWKESEDATDTLWRELGAKNPHPELCVTECKKSAERRGDELTRGWQAIWAVDKEHVFWQNHAPGNAVADLRHYNRAVHAAGCDVYPAPFNTGVRHASAIANVDLTSVGGFTDHMRAGAPGKASWMVLQGFGWVDLKDRFNPQDPTDGRRPTYQETRFMAYDALFHGANALMYWGTYTIQKDSDLWNSIMKVCAELRALEPAIVGAKPPFQPDAVSETNYTTFNGGDPKLMLRQVGGDWVLMALNEQRVGVAYQVTGLPDALNGKTLFRLNSTEEHTVQNGGFRDGILPQDIIVYATSRGFEAANKS